MTVVLPAYNEQDNIDRAVGAIGQVLSDAGINYDLIFVDDGSRDLTWKRIDEAAARDNHVHGVSFSRNFGKEAAVLAGVAQADGDCVAVMDCDLQHPAETLVPMYQKWQEGYEVIEGVKKSRGDESKFHKASARSFYTIMSKATGVDMSRASDFKLMDRRAVDALLSLPEYHTFFRALSSWVGFATTEVEFDVAERVAGESKWSTGKLIKYAINNIMEFSSAPMQLVTWAGGIFFVFAVILAIQTLVRYAMGDSAGGFTTVILLILITGSIIMIALGIIGTYLEKIYDETKRRPRYIVSKKI